MKKTILLFITIYFIFVLTGCTNQYASINDLRLGMQIFEVAEIHQKPLVPVGMQSGVGYDLAQYQAWFLTPYNERNSIKQILYGSTGERSMPYKLTFEVYPPLTHEQCLKIAELNKVTDPKELESLMSIEGLRLSKLVQAVIDEGALQRQAIERQAAITRSAIHQQQFNQMQQMQQLQQIQWNLNQIQFNQM